MKTIAIAGTFDSKGEELSYVKEILEGLGLNTLTIDCGVFEPKVKTDVSNAEVAAEIGEDIKEIAAKRDRALATELMSKAKAVPLPYQRMLSM